MILVGGGGTSKSTDTPPPQHVTQGLGGVRTPRPAGDACCLGVQTPSPKAWLKVLGGLGQAHARQSEKYVARCVSRHKVPVECAKKVGPENFQSGSGSTGEGPKSLRRAQHAVSETVLCACRADETEQGRVCAHGRACTPADRESGSSPWGPRTLSVPMEKI